MSSVRRLITATHVLAGPAGQHIHDGAVLLDGDTISAVGPRQQVERQAGQDVTHWDFPGRTVLPGLIDCHVHLALDTSSDPVGSLCTAEDTDLLLAMAGRAQRALDGGVTTVRDLGDRGGLAIRVRDAIARGEIAGPRVQAAAAPLTVPRGHCWFFGGEVSGEAAIRQQVQHNAALGADVIKVMASGGHITANSPAMWESQFTADELRIIVEEAAGAGLPVAAHAHGTEAIVAAVEAGVHTVEHCTWMSASGGPGGDRRDEVAKQMADRGIYACVAQSEHWSTTMASIGPAKAELRFGRLNWLEGLGVPLIAGTDAGLSGTLFDGLPRMLGLYEHLGFPPERIIEIATLTSAEALGLAAVTGRLAPGLAADLIVVDGNPLTDVRALHHLELTIARGKPHHPTAQRSTAQRPKN